MQRFILLLLLIVFSCSDTGSLNGEPSKPENDAKALSAADLSQLELPEKMDFCGEEVPLHDPEVRERAEREFYLNLQNPGQVILYLKRAGRYFPMFESILKENGVPDDMKYLAVAESALFMARSPKGALGLWQFMPATGKEMGLQIDKYVDERRHPEKSTEAACEYLKYSYKINKSWTMAAAGYNMGPGGARKNMSFQKGGSFYDLFLNEETSRYILRIAIIKEIMKNSRKYGFIFDKEDLYSPYDTEIIKVYGPVGNLAEWAIKQGATYKDIKLLNPWILKRELPKPSSGGFYEIAVPKK